MFPDGEGRPPRLRDESDQGWTLNALTNSYSLAGRPAAAVPVLQQAADMAGKQGNKKNLAIGLGNLTTDQMKIGTLATADANLRRRITLCREIEDRFNEAIGHMERGRLLAYCGDGAGAAAELDTALEQLMVENEIQSQGIVWAYRALAALLQGDGRAAQTAAGEALRLADETARTRYPVEQDYVRTHWLLGWAALATGDLDAAQQYLDEALRRCRAINLVELEPAILLVQARLARAVKRNGISFNYTDEARAIAERAGYRLDLADIHNFLAQLALDAGDRATARRHAQTARDYAWCDGPPFAYQPALEEAERLLQETSTGYTEPHGAGETERHRGEHEDE